MHWCSVYCRSSYLQCEDNLKYRDYSICHNDILLFFFNVHWKLFNQCIVSRKEPINTVLPDIFIKHILQTVCHIFRFKPTQQRLWFLLQLGNISSRFCNSDLVFTVGKDLVIGITTSVLCCKVL